MNSAPRSHITGVPGWESAGEQAELFRRAQEVPAGGFIVEIGAEFGMSASLFIKGAVHRGAYVISIDLFPGDMLDVHRRNLLRAGLGNASLQVIGNSHEIGEKWPLALGGGILLQSYTGIDLLFIDGDHSYAGALADLKLWTPHVKAGGIVALHDVAQETNARPHPLHFEVRQALDEWMPKRGYKVAHRIDSLCVLKKG